MPGAILGPDSFAIAFDFSRSEAAAYVNAAGANVTAAIDAPRFDHDPGGVELGLLVTAGSDFGAQDRVTIDPAMLPVELLTGAGEAATVFHWFDGGSGPQRRAFYSRAAQATIDALLAQAGHHLAIGAVPGFRPNKGGFVRYRGEAWQLPGIVTSSGAGLLGQPGRALLSCGAEPV